jgi:hypothetical protein
MHHDAVSHLEPAQDARAADWLLAGLRGFGESVLSIVPAGFERYVRLFHPPYRRRNGQLLPVRWAEIAAVRGKRCHPGMQLHALTDSYQLGNPPPPDFDHWPQLGSLPLPECRALATALTRWTSAETAWFAFWNGYGDTRDNELLVSSPTFKAPAREYFLLTGPPHAATGKLPDSGRFQSANLWWPDDHTWCVASEIDLITTYIGCSEQCCQALLDVPGLETLEIDPATGIDFDSDFLNR